MNDLGVPRRVVQRSDVERQPNFSRPQLTRPANRPQIFNALYETSAHQPRSTQYRNGRQPQERNIRTNTDNTNVNNPSSGRPIYERTTHQQNNLPSNRMQNRPRDMHRNRLRNLYNTAPNHPPDFATLNRMFDELYDMMMDYDEYQTRFFNHPH